MTLLSRVCLASPAHRVGAAVVASVDPVAATIETPIDTVAPLVEALVDPVALAVQPVRQTMPTCGVGTIRLAVQPAVDAIAFPVEAMIDPVAAPKPIERLDTELLRKTEGKAPVELVRVIVWLDHLPHREIADRANPSQRS